MKNQLSDIERKILSALQHGLPQSRKPFEDVAEKIGIETAQLLDILKQWKQNGKIRRIGAIVDHFQVGLGAGAMVVWQANPEQTEKVGKILAAFEEVSHAYERCIDKSWPYNIYTMVHGKDNDDLQQIIRRMSTACGIPDYRILVTRKELKKVPPTYVK
jgi:DNA-binding Lrp family transcriptional regulator